MNFGNDFIAEIACPATTRYGSGNPSYDYI